MLKYLGSWIYQCSEGDVPEDELYKLMDEARNMIAKDIVYDLPEYNESSWA